MTEFNYIIIGGGCAGLSLAYELEIHKKLQNKTLAIIEPRLEYKRDKTWSFWKVTDHSFEDCVIKSWDNFTINTASASNQVMSKKFPYQSINSEIFYKKINNRLSQNKNIKFFKNLNEINTNNAFIFNSVPSANSVSSNLWQHFQGVEIETSKDIFDKDVLNLMDFNCEQRNAVHFFYTLPFSKNKALVETTWISNLNNDLLKDYDSQIENYIKYNLNIKNYKINYSEKGAIPLFYPLNIKKKNKINIGTAGGMTRLSTGYTFLNIQEHSRYLRENIDNIENLKIYEIPKKYKFLDKIFLKVLIKYPEKMPNIFYKFFNSFSNSTIRFLSNKSNFFEDFLIILKMPKIMFMKVLFKND